MLETFADKNGVQLRDSVKTTQRSSWWSVTLFDVSDEKRALLRAPPEFVREMVYQDEITPTTQRLHIQCAVNTTQIRFSQLSEWLQGAHIEKAYKPGEALVNYCSKRKTAVPGTQVHYTTRQSVRQTNDIEDAPPIPAFSLKEILLTIAAYVHEDDAIESDLTDMYHMALDKIARVCPDLLEKVTRQNIFQAWKHTGYAFLDYQRVAAELEYADDKEETLTDCVLCDCDKDECTHCFLRESLLLLTP